MSVIHTPAGDKLSYTSEEIDRRLGLIKNRTYINQNLGSMPNHTSYTYSGLSFTIPANSYYNLTFEQIYAFAAPTGIAISDSSTAMQAFHVFAIAESSNRAAMSGVTGSTARTAYIWAKAQSETENNQISVSGLVENI